MKKSFRLLLKLLFTLFIVLLITAIAFPFFFRDRINSEFKKAIGQHIEGEFDYGKIGLSLFKTFPDLNVTVNDLRIGGKKMVDGQPDLFNSQSVSFGLDIMSLIRNQDSLEVKSFGMQKPVIYVYTHTDGAVNYDIYTTKESASASETSSALQFHLKNYSIVDADITYVDAGSGMSVMTQPMDHTGDFIYKGNQAIWNTQTETPSFTIIQNQITYLNKAEIKWDAKMNIDLAKERYTFGENKLALNNLLLSMVGFAEKAGAGWDMDFTFDTGENSFKNLISLLPNLYTKDFDKINARGLLKLNGHLKGQFNSTQNKFPKFGLNFDIKDGAFQYPGKPAAFNNINVEGTLNNKLNVPGVTEVHLPTFRFTLNDRPFSGNLELYDLHHTATYRTSVKGEIDLGDVYQAYPMETIEALSGVLKMDADISGSADPNKLADAKYAGTASIRDMEMKAKDQPRLAIRLADADLKNDYVDIKSLDGQIGSSDFNGSAEVRQLLTAFMSDRPMEVNAHVSGKTLNFNEFIKEETTKANVSNVPAPTDDWRRRAKFEISSQYDEVVYENYAIKDIDFKGAGSLESFLLNKMTGSIQNSPVNIVGKLTQIYDYTFGDGTLKGDLTFDSPLMVLENWMEEAPAAGQEAQAETVYTVVPERVDLNVVFNANEVKYQNINLKQVQGQLAIKDQKIVVTDMTGKTLGGGFDVEGLYGFNGVGQPDFNIKYDLSKFSFEKTFEALETFRLLVPIGKYVDGVYNTNLIMTGKLGDDYLPNFDGLSASGFLETLHGSIKNFGPLKATADKLNISALDQINLDYTRNWFEIEDGFLSLKPFEKSIDDIDMKISGRHKILGDMDYAIRMNVPIEKFEKLGVPSAVKDTWNGLASKLGGSGINIPGINEVVIDVLLKGRISQPKVEFKIVNFQEKSAGDMANEIVQDVVAQVKDSVNTIIKEKEKIIKDTLNTVITQVTDSVQTRVEEEVSAITSQVKDKAKDAIVSQIDSSLQDSAKAKVKEILGEDVENEIDKLKDKLGGWKPF